MKDKFIPALRYDWLTRLYDPVLSITMPEREIKNALLRQANISANQQVLDFGCGSLTLSIMAKNLEPLALIHAIDVDENVLKIAEEKRLKAKTQISVQLYDGKVLPFQGDSFDRVVSSLVFHHLDKGQKMRALTQIFRVLKPGGEIHIADWGKAKNGLMRTAFYLVQFLDGFKTTTDNVKGLLPIYMNDAGFSDARKTVEFQTIFGTLALYKGRKALAS